VKLYLFGSKSIINANIYVNIMFCLNIRTNDNCESFYIVYKENRIYKSQVMQDLLELTDQTIKIFNNEYKLVDIFIDVGKDVVRQYFSDRVDEMPLSLDILKFMLYIQDDRIINIVHKEGFLLFSNKSTELNTLLNNHSEYFGLRKMMFKYSYFFDKETDMFVDIHHMNIIKQIAYYDGQNIDVNTGNLYDERFFGKQKIMALCNELIRRIIIPYRFWRKEYYYYSYHFTCPESINFRNMPIYINVQDIFILTITKVTIKRFVIKGLEDHKIKKIKIYSGEMSKNIGDFSFNEMYEPKVKYFGNGVHTIYWNIIDKICAIVIDYEVIDTL